jgi:hypothetical protein
MERTGADSSACPSSPNPRVRSPVHVGEVGELVRKADTQRGQSTQTGHLGPKDFHPLLGWIPHLVRPASCQHADRVEAFEADEVDLDLRF